MTNEECRNALGGQMAATAMGLDMLRDALRGHVEPSSLVNISQRFAVREAMRRLEAAAVGLREANKTLRPDGPREEHVRPHRHLALQWRVLASASVIDLLLEAIRSAAEGVEDQMELEDGALLDCFLGALEQFRDEAFNFAALLQPTPEPPGPEAAQLV